MHAECLRFNSQHLQVGLGETLARNPGKLLPISVGNTKLDVLNGLTRYGIAFCVAFTCDIYCIHLNGYKARAPVLIYNVPFTWKRLLHHGTEPFFIDTPPCCTKFISHQWTSYGTTSNIIRHTLLFPCYLPCAMPKYHPKFHYISCGRLIHEKHNKLAMQRSRGILSFQGCKQIIFPENSERGWEC